jgi:2-methylcitrate dehydratase
MPTSITIRLNDGRSFRIEKAAYEGFHTRPMSWQAVVEKFTRLTERFTSDARREVIIKAVADLEHLRVRELTAALATLQ